jgi:hypothetical protein
MSLQQMPSIDQNLIRKCLLSICDGPFLEDAEFHSRIGVERRELKKIMQEWPIFDDSDDDSDLAVAINNALNELCYGLPISSQDWANWIEVPQTDILRAYADWARLRGWDNTGIR